MMKIFAKFPRKNEKGQVLVFVALTFIALVAIVGLAVDMGYMYVSYARLRRGVDAAALAGTGEFRIPDALIGTGTCDAACVVVRDANISAAIQQFLDLNEIEPDSTAGWTNPLQPGSPGGITVETCEKNLGDPDVVAVLCAAPVQKIIRVTIQQRVPLFFLAVIGFREVPIVVDSFASAASADVMLTLDTSDSMTYDLTGSTNRDPHSCNSASPPFCQPMEDVKDAANAFADRLYYPYDRLGIATFDQYAYVKLALSTDIAQIHTTIDAIRVFEGVTTLLDDGTMSGTKCIYFRDYKNIDPAPDAPGSDDDPSYPWAYNPDAGYWDFLDPAGDEAPPQRLAETGPAVRYVQDPYGPCRLFDEDGGNFVRLDCPMNYGPDPDPSRCGTTNIGGAVDIATRALTGVYPGYIASPPASRDDSVWVLVLLTDGAATAAYNSAGNPLCPPSTFEYNCRHPDPTNRTTNPADPEYDAQDQPRDMFDIALGDNINVFTIGLGNAVTLIPPYSGGVAPAEYMLKYPETAAPIKGGSAKYFFAPGASDLFPIFVEIANLITSRINQ